MTAYYNEFDKCAAAWLRELIAEGLIAPGDVDERSILDVTPNDLVGYTQCHFFAGIGGWSLALRLAGWPDHRPVWTGSCPCQPFSEAGGRAGFADERHLWPAFFHLIREFRPAKLFGEQVEAAIRYGWLDLVHDDLEGIGYTFAAAGLPAACVGAPHIRQRLWFVADTECADVRSQGLGALGGTPTGMQGAHRQREWLRADVGSGCTVMGSVAHSSSSQGLEGRDARALGLERASAERGGADGAPGHASVARFGGAEDALSDQRHSGSLQERGQRLSGLREPQRAGFWSRAEWLACRDGKARPVEPGVFPLAHGVPDRVGLLRGAGNAIVPQVAAAFIQASEYARLAATFG